MALGPPLLRRPAPAVAAAGGLRPPGARGDRFAADPGPGPGRSPARLWSPPTVPPAPFAVRFGCEGDSRQDAGRTDSRGDAVWSARR